MAGENYTSFAAQCYCGAPVKHWLGVGRRPIRCEAHHRKPVYTICASHCYCGAPVKNWLGVGRKPKRCEAHLGEPVRNDQKTGKEKSSKCPSCLACFEKDNNRKIYCSRICGVRHRRGNLARGLHKRKCAVCCASFEAISRKAMYCSSSCKQRDWKKKNGRVIEPRKVSAYWAGYCKLCNAPIGGKYPRARCEECNKVVNRTATNIANKAIHKANARVKNCKECGVAFCPLYGYGNALLCGPCSKERKNAHERACRAKRRARLHDGDAESVDPYKVFDRDGWRCALCGVKTPKAKRGSIDKNAPELDHIIPLSKGGSHSYRNTQCACRSCNQAKGARALGQLLLIG